MFREKAYNPLNQTIISLRRKKRRSNSRKCFARERWNKAGKVVGRTSHAGIRRCSPEKEKKRKIELRKLFGWVDGIRLPTSRGKLFSSIFFSKYITILSLLYLHPIC